MMTAEIIPILDIAKIIERTMKDIQEEMNELMELEKKTGMTLDVARDKLTDEADTLKMTWDSFYDEETQARIEKEQAENDGK